MRKRLQCKNFKWYLQNIYHEKFIPDENVQAFGRIRLRNTNLCLDSLNHDEQDFYNLGIHVCNDNRRPYQVLFLVQTVSALFLIRYNVIFQLFYKYFLTNSTFL